MPLQRSQRLSFCFDRKQEVQSTLRVQDIANIETSHHSIDPFQFCCLYHFFLKFVVWFNILLKIMQYMVRINEWLLQKCKKNWQQESEESSNLVPYWCNFHLDIVGFLSARWGVGWRLLAKIGTAGTGRRLLPFARFSVCRMDNMLLEILGRIWGLRGKKAFLYFCWYICLYLFLNALMHS